MMKLYLDAGTTWSKIIATRASDKFLKDFSMYFVFEKSNRGYFIAPSKFVKQSGFKFEKSTGHMASGLINDEKDHTNEILALVQGANDYLKGDSIILDLGSRDAKWVKFKDSKFKDLDWNSSCASATGATIEMLLKFYDVDLKELCFVGEKYNITCGIFGLERIMDDIAGETEPKVAISRFVHGVAYNAWCFAKKPEKLYLSGGFCENTCFVQSLSHYCQVNPLGRFVLCEGIID